MFIISKSLIAQEKLERLATGRIAFAESREVIQKIEEEIAKNHLSVICEKTEQGCWFTPDHSSQVIKQ